MATIARKPPGLFITRSIDALARETEAVEGKPRLRRALGPWALVAIGLGDMVGAGIFATIGTGVHMAGPAVIISFIIAGIACAFAALCYAELSSMVPIAGSAYTYTYATIGEFIAWIIGWDLILEYAISAAPVATALSQNLQTALAGMGLHVPAWLAAAHSASTPAGIFDIGAFLTVLVIAILVAIGIRESAGTNSIMVVVKMAILAVFVIVGAFFIHAANWHPFNPIGFARHYAGGQPIGIIAGAFYVFFAFIGFDAVTTTAEEAKNPQRDLPIGVLGSLALGGLFYMLVAVVLTGMQPTGKIDVNAPLAIALQSVGKSGLVWLMALGAALGALSVILTSLLGQARIFYVMARDGLLPKWVAAVHPRFRTPARMTMITGIVVAILAGFVPLDWLLSLVNIGTLSAFVLVCLAVIVLRYAQPQRERRFRTPLVPVLPALGVLICGWLAIDGSGPLVWKRFIIWLIVGLAIYFVYGYRNSEARKAAVAAAPAGD